MTSRVYRDPMPDAPRGPVTGVHPRAERPREELSELVAVRGLLCELRPGELHDTTGPLAWSPLVHEPTHEEPRQGALARRIRVQTSVGPSDGPKDAFAALASVSPGVEADARIREIAREGGIEPSLALAWLQRCGTLVDGLGALYAAAGEALASDARRARWATQSGPLLAERRRLAGREAVLYALRWWRGERPVCGGQHEDCEGVSSGAGCMAGAARCQRPETVRVRGPRCRRGA